MGAFFNTRNSNNPDRPITIGLYPGPDVAGVEGDITLAEAEQMIDALRQAVSLVRFPPSPMFYVGPV